MSAANLVHQLHITHRGTLEISSGSQYPSSWTSPAIQALFQDTSNQTASTTANPPSTSQQSHSHLSHGAVAGLVIGCVAASLLCALGAIYTIQRKNRNRNKNSNSAASYSAGLQINNKDRHVGELPTKRDFYEIMTESSDRTELPNSKAKTPIELA